MEQRFSFHKGTSPSKNLMDPFFSISLLSEEFEYLRGNKKERRPTFSTGPLLGYESLICCRGRLNDADLSNDAQNPIFLPKNTELTRLIIFLIILMTAFFVLVFLPLVAASVNAFG